MIDKTQTLSEMQNMQICLMAPVEDELCFNKRGKGSNLLLESKC